MKKMNKYKITLLVLCVMMMTSAVFTGTLAYLTDHEKVINTFTVGQVQITLDETEVTPDGKPTTDPPTRVTKNEYHLVPGEKYTKDPTITLGAGSEKSYIRMIMTVYNRSAVDTIIANAKNGLNDYADLLEGWDETVWVYKGFSVNEPENAISFEFRYKEAVAGEDTAKALEPLFTHLSVPSTLNGEELKALYDGNFRIVVEGHAIQATGFSDVTEPGEEGQPDKVTKTAEDVAWEAFSNQMAAEAAITQTTQTENTNDEIEIQ